MIDPDSFLSALHQQGIEFVCGVPDSLLKDVCAAIQNNLPENKHIITSNEGSAVAMAIGHYLATQKPALVYLQNSGFGNIINPVASLASNEVYGIPMILMIGWRGEITPDGTQLKDEPQHVLQGKITQDQAELLKLPVRTLDSSGSVDEIMQWAAETALKKHTPVVILVRKNTFSACRLEKATEQLPLPTREEVIQLVAGLLPADSPVVSTTGKTSRELYEFRKRSGSGHQRDFLTVGGMGHASQIAAGLALALGGKPVYCLDGDGAMLMHMGALVTSAECSTLRHIVLNNGAHESVGGQPTAAMRIQLTEIAKACGYRSVSSVNRIEEIPEALKKMNSSEGSAFLEIRCSNSSRKELGRPESSPSENKQSFLTFIETHGKANRDN